MSTQRYYFVHADADPIKSQDGKQGVKGGRISLNFPARDFHLSINDVFVMDRPVSPCDIKEIPE